MPKGNPKGYAKPHFATAGQPTPKVGSPNKKGGGAAGQSSSTLNRPCKPHMGAQGQKSAGPVSRGTGGGKIAHDVY